MFFSKWLFVVDQFKVVDCVAEHMMPSNLTLTHVTDILDGSKTDAAFLPVINN